MINIPMNTRAACKLALPAALALATFAAHSQSIFGVPEPGLILFGQVRNAAAGNSLLTYGTLRWTITPSGGGAAITVTVTLTNINDQFSYIVRVPFESVLAGLTLSPGALALSGPPANYNRSATIGETFAGSQQPATIVAPAIGNFTFGAADRGRIERVDLQVSISFTNTGGDGIPDAWRQQYFGSITNTTNSCAACDPDGDGMSNMAEFKAGTNPNDPQSRFAFIDVRLDPMGGIAVRWSSVALNHYTMQRSATVTGGFTDLMIGILATPGTNYIRDATATDVGPYFYRLRVE
jgi:hypothetical protein